MDTKEAFLVVESSRAVLYDTNNRCPECVLHKSRTMFPDLPSQYNPSLTTPGSKVPVLTVFTVSFYLTLLFEILDTKYSIVIDLYMFSS